MPQLHHVSDLAPAKLTDSIRRVLLIRGEQTLTISGLSTTSADELVNHSLGLQAVLLTASIQPQADALLHIGPRGGIKVRFPSYEELLEEFGDDPNVTITPGPPDTPPWEDAND